MCKKVIVNKAGFLAVAGILFGFVSCDNFFHGAEIDSQLQKKIEYSKAKSCNVSVSTENGTVKNAGSYSLKPTDSLYIEYSEGNSGFQFVKWICEPADSITFSDETALSTKITVVSSNNNIEIKPLIHKRPVVTAVKPDGKKITYPRDSSVVIVFSENLSQENDFSAIRIVSDENDVTEHFKSPVLLDNILTFAVDKENLIYVEPGTKKNITVSVPEELYYLKDQTKISMKENYTFSYVINEKLDENAPEIKEFKIAKNKEDLEQDLNLYTQGTFEQQIASLGAEEFFTENYHVSSVNFSFDVKDQESGLAYLRIVEKFRYDYSLGHLTEYTIGNTVESLIPLSDYLLLDGEAAGFYNYKLSPALENGIVELSFSFVDNCGNETESFVFSMIKDIKSYYLSLTNGYEARRKYDMIENGDDAYCYKENGMKRILEAENLVGITVTNRAWAVYNNKSFYKALDLESINAVVEVYDSNNRLIEKLSKPEFYCSAGNEHYITYKLAEKLDCRKGYYLKATVTDDLGNTNVDEMKIEPVPEIINCVYEERGTDDKVFVLSFSETPVTYGSKWGYTSIYYSYDDVYYEWFSEAFDSGYFEYAIPVDSAEDKIYVYVGYYDYPTVLSDQYILQPSSVVDDSETKPVFDYTYEPVREVNSQKYNLNVTLSQDEFNKYDSFVLNLYLYEDRVWYVQHSYNLTVGTNSITVESLKSNKLPGAQVNEYQFEVCAIKNNQIYKSSKEELKISKNPEDDYCAPDIETFSFDDSSASLKMRLFDYPASTSGQYNLNNSNLLNDDDSVTVKIYELGYDKPGVYFKGLTEDEIKQYPFVEFTDTPDEGKYIYYPLTKYRKSFEEMEQLGHYNFAVFVQDKNGNYSYTIEDFRIGNFKTEIFKTYSAQGIINKLVKKNSVSGLTDETVKDFMTPFIYDSSTKTGSWGKSVTIGSTAVTISEEFFYENSSYKAKFFRVNTKFAVPFYFYSEKSEVQAKDFRSFFKETEQSTGKETYKYSFYSDKPVFYHVLYSSEDLGSDPQEWERWVPQKQKLHESILTPNVNFVAESAKSYLSEIPEGSYYCAIAWYQDNTCVMSPVRHK